MSRDPYNAATRELFADPKHVGELADAATAYFEDKSLRITLSAHHSGERLVALRFRLFGCPHLLAACEHFCRAFEGQNVSKLGQFDSSQLMSELGVPIEKTGRILVLEDTVRSLKMAIVDRIDHATGTGK